MSEHIQIGIIIPIATEELGDLSANEIISAIKNRSSHEQEIKDLTLQLSEMKAHLKATRVLIFKILNEMDDPYQKAKAMRNLADILDNLKL